MFNLKSLTVGILALLISTPGVLAYYSEDVGRVNFCDGARLGLISTSFNSAENLNVKWNFKQNDAAEGCKPANFSHYFIKLNGVNQNGEKINYGYLIWKNADSIKEGLGKMPFSGVNVASFTRAFRSQKFSVPGAWFRQSNLINVPVSVTVFACGSYDGTTSNTCGKDDDYIVSSGTVKVNYQVLD